MSILPFAALILATSGQAGPGADEGSWAVVFRDGPVIVSLNRAATRREGHRLRARIRVDDPRDLAGARWSLATLEIDCRATTVRSLEKADFAADGRELRRVGAEAAPHAPPTETGRRFLQAVCRATEVNIV